MQSARTLLRVLLTAVAPLLVTIAFAPAHADTQTLAGSWSAGPLAETVNVTSWVDDCGPKPKGGGSGAASYKVTTSGDELVFSGPHAFRTDSCWEMQGARRVSHSATPSLRWWKTRCESPPGDPRKAAITTVVRALNDDTIVLSESAHYTTTVAAGECAADVERSRTFKITAREGAASATASSGSASATTTAATTTATPSITATPTVKAPPATPVCESLGEPATLEVRPKRKIIRPGEQFDFKARVLDSKGCELTSKVTFRLAPESSTLASTVIVDPSGRVKVRADAEPVSVALVVEGASKIARVELEVVSDQRYAELLGSGGLDDAGVDDQAVSVVVSGGVGGGGNNVVDPQVDEGARKRFAYLAIAGGACTLLALAGLIVWRRSAPPAVVGKRRRPVAGTARARRVEAEARERAMANLHASLPAPRASAGVGVQTIIGGPDAPGSAAGSPGGSLGAPVQAHGRACPTCGSMFPTDADFCPHDGSRLVPSAGLPPGTVAPQVSPALDLATQPGRICPICGKRYGREAAFCGKDGVELVPLN